MAAETIVQAMGRPTAAARERALHAYPTALEGRLRRLLHAGPRVREADRQPQRHEARDASRAPASDPHEVHPEAARPTSPIPVTETPLTTLINALTKVVPAA